MSALRPAFHKTALAALAAALFAGAAISAPSATGPDQGVTSTTIKLGRTSSFTGILARNAEASEAGIRAAFAEANAAGGIYGRKIEMVSVDDSYVVEKSKAAAAKLVNEEKVFAMVLSNGTAQTGAIIPIIDAAKVPLVGSTSGSVGRKAEQRSRYFFNTRNSNLQDLQGIADHVKLMGTPNLCVVYQDDNYGKTMLSEMEIAAKAAEARVVGRIAVPPSVVDGAPYVAQVQQGECAHAGNVAMLMLDKPTGAFLKSASELHNSHRLFATTSSGEFELVAGAKASANVIVSQTMPSIHDPAFPVISEFRALMAKTAPQYVDSVLAFEGFLSARVVIAGLKDAGANPTREGFVSALEKFHMRDFGGLYYSYDTPEHVGLGYQEMFMWGKKGNQIY